MTTLRVLGDDELRAGPGVVRAGPAAPPWPHQPTVEWQVCGVCNYDCSYCIQSKKHRVGVPDDATLDAILAFLASLDGRWEVKTTGGEPFAFAKFAARIIPFLVDETPHTVSTLTNLAAPQRVIVAFAERTRGRLGVVSASLHLEHTTPTVFLARLRALREHVDPSARIVVNAVLVPGRLDEVAAAQAAVVKDGFTFFPQLMKVKHGVHAYSPDDMAKVRAIVGDLELAARTRSANLAPAYTGRACWSGARYLVVDQEGRGHSCRSAKRHGEGALGDAKRGTLRLRPGPVECPYTICPCTVPANRGMIEGVVGRSVEE